MLHITYMSNITNSNVTDCGKGIKLHFIIDYLLPVWILYLI